MGELAQTVEATGGGDAASGEGDGAGDGGGGGDGKGGGDDVGGGEVDCWLQVMARLGLLRPGPMPVSRQRNPRRRSLTLIGLCACWGR